MTDKTNDFKELVKQFGPKKAAEIIRTTGKPLEEDFAKTHKKLDTFSNKTTDEIIQQLEKENEIQTTSGNYGDSILYVQSSFSLKTTQSTEFAQHTVYAE